MALGFFRARRRIILAAALLALAGCSQQGGSSGGATETVKNQTPSGTVEMSQIQAAFIGSGATGDGTLRFRGRTYPFSVSGLGVGGIGVSTVEATGEVYDLAKADDFEGAYIQGRYGFALGEESGGALWLKNDKGVVIRLKTKRTGLMLSLGGDAVVITLKR